ncbi:MAG: outer membrane protein assembly factor BamB family protein, partial [Planctomycetota bacterium]
MKLRTPASLTLLLACSYLPAQSPGLDWPQWRGEQRDGVWREEGVLQDFPAEFTPRWSTPIGSGYCGPTVAKGRVYVMDRLVEPEEVERVHCFDWQTGEELWSFEYPCTYERVSYKAGPRCSVLVANDRAYSLGAAGHLFCFDALTGELLWAHDLDEVYEIDMPIWGIAAAPVLYEELLIVPASAKDAYLIAFDAESGEEIWTSQGDRGNYSAPIILEQAGEDVLVSWTGDRVIGVNPISGELSWEVPFKAKNMPLGVASPVQFDNRLFFTGFYDGSLMLELDQDELAVRELWRRRGQNERSTDALHSTIATPLFLGEYIYGVDSYGELRCLEAETGDRVWEDLTAVPRNRWSTIHFVRSGEEVLMFNEAGELIRARLSSEGYEELARGKLIEPTLEQLDRRGKGVAWSHPAFAYRHVFVRN